MPIKEFHRHRYVELEGDEQLIRVAAEVPVGGTLAINTEVPLWENLGFVADPDNSARLTRSVVLDSTFPAVPAHAPGFQEIDCVTVLTLQRSGDKQYLYDTLRSVFETFPSGLQVNLAVGDDRADFVSRERLAAELGPGLAQQVHAWPATTAETNFLKQFGVHRRACWNYARALRSYAGSTGMLLLEDDVQWAVGGPQAIEKWLSRCRLPVVSLYNYQAGAPGEDWTFNPYHLVSTNLSAPRPVFDCTQAMYYDASVARAIGNYILLRKHTRPYDLLLSDFAARHELLIGHTYPSLVQHKGEQTTGLGNFHRSGCFLSNPRWQE